MKKILCLLPLILIAKVNADNDSQLILHSGEKIHITTKSNVEFAKGEQFAELLFDINDNSQLNQCIVATSVSISKDHKRLDIRIEDLICVGKKGNISDSTIRGSLIGDDKIPGIKINNITTNPNGSVSVNVKNQKALITLEKELAVY